MKPDNMFIGKSVAVTGKLENYTRDGIKTRAGSKACIRGEQEERLPDLGREARQ